MTNGSIFNWGKVSLLEISGPDSNDFLHRLATVSFKQQLAKPIYGAFLTGQAKLISLFTAWSEGEKIFLFVEPEMFDATQKYLEQMHFGENLKIKTMQKHCLEFRNSSGHPLQVLAYNWGLSGFYIFSDQFMDPLTFFGYDILLRRDYDALRAWYGYAKPAKDITTDHLLIEAPLEDQVDRDKGCYPGQEVIEKILNIGKISKKIIRVNFVNRPPKISIPHPLLNGDDNVGTLTSLYEKDGKFFGIATLKRLFLEKNRTLKTKDFELTW